ncbi:MAG: LLM class flavin-dependent oxidoreductase [Candidatus Cohnella colombiensis]|uniref:LLM class flavin-dependent oxidoreductase n=1 Tax=Candidatus Cohnella colombiensis TaxID=3121368 RepID=A0AA95JFA0_9BACL|nr:MAG: LLM class flavin-dependent oxidoreductase [Cohnella sp.]
MTTHSSSPLSHNTLNDIPLSILDLAPVIQGGTVADTFHRSLVLAQHAERLGFHRYWLAEHHNMPGIASSATSLLISHIAAGTERIRVGSGGIMLPNHAPLVIAEQFGTLETLYPGRIDLGLGRAPGSDHATARALRRGLGSDGQQFPAQLQELRSYFQPDDSAVVHAHPGEGLHIPIWLLGSSGFSAQLASQLGLPFAFASHFAPDYLLPAIEAYRAEFKPSAQLERPYVMVGTNIIVADTDEEAQRLATSQYQSFLGIIRGHRGYLQPPVDSMDTLWSAQEEQYVLQMLRYSAIGNPETVRAKLIAMLADTNADELIVAGQIYDHNARVKSYELLAELVKTK